ncbi:MAG: CPBP family intramembrane metalloprotease [Planctomycetes bacterium]|nr:CPBP family intramembrane metalloprotease [Planctomycetota bacterium]
MVAEATTPDVFHMLGPWWLLAAVAACLPISAAVFWRVGRWWITAEPVPPPLDRDAPPAPWRDAVGVGLFIGMQVLAMGLAAGYGAAADAGLLPWEPIDIPPEFSPGVFLAQVLPPLVGLAVVLAYGRRGLAAAGVRAGRVASGILHGLVTFATILPACVAALVVSISAMQLLRAPVSSHPLITVLREAPAVWMMVAGVVQAVVLAPLVEEFMYRGVLLGSLVRPVGVVGALVGSSAVFAMVHLPTEPQAVPPLFILGMALGYAAYRTRSLVAPVLAHALFNALMIFGTLWSGD